jgi:hypothetical protein
MEKERKKERMRKQNKKTTKKKKAWSTNYSTRFVSLHPTRSPPSTCPLHLGPCPALPEQLLACKMQWAILGKHIALALHPEELPLLARSANMPGCGVQTQLGRPLFLHPQTDRNPDVIKC